MEIDRFQKFWKMIKKIFIYCVDDGCKKEKENYSEKRKIIFFHWLILLETNFNINECIFIDFFLISVNFSTVSLVDKFSHFDRFTFLVLEARNFFGQQIRRQTNIIQQIFDKQKNEKNDSFFLVFLYFPNFLSKIDII